ncbi:MAG: hypothetical protein IJM97_07880 [Clostridia bacterium]|nr:hypothetical protein [Clostridia bacterium]
MLNELSDRMKRIYEIPATPENEQKLRDELQILYMITENMSNKILSNEVRIFAKCRLSELDDIKIMSLDKIPKSRYELNTLLLRIFKKLDKEGRRISFRTQQEKIHVLTNEKIITVLFERLLLFSKNRISVEIKEKRIKIKSDCSFSRLMKLRNCKSDLILVIDKILKINSQTMFISSLDSGSEISLSLEGILCNESD